MNRRHADARTGLRASFRPLLDDAGNRTRLMKRRDIVRAARSDSPQLRLLAQRLKAATKSEAVRVTPDRLLMGAALALGILVAQIATYFVTATLFGSMGFGLGLLTLVAWGVAAHLLLGAYIRSGTRHQLARTAVAEGVCGSCAFPLRDVPPDDHDRLVCPECGAAWDRARVVAPFWERPATNLLRRHWKAWITPGVRPVSTLLAPDDRGRYVQTPDSRLVRVEPATLATIDPEERRRLVAAMRRVGRAWRILMMVALLWMPALIGVALYQLWTEEQWLAMALLATLGLIVTLPVAVLPFSVAFCTPHRTSRIIVAGGRCGTCVRPLDDAPTDADGRAECPACGSAWLRQTNR